MTPGQDRQRVDEGLETLADASRGALFRLVGDPAGVFDRIESELAGYYLLGVETDPRDRDGKLHPVKVDVAMRGANVRARRQVLTPCRRRRRPPASPGGRLPRAVHLGARR